ncbi:trk system potassium uptake protein TrkH [Keratinibaculum paraultunense]|uniref:Trk system potassium uptake protein TrkH n=1 Tax=Keratinibaculum paraultunense TaxID=1278232 RepID=A0A4R3KYI0_9FIRM|nr:TrkH family potassium uptake protein [Keratinibaculum paraultunense]QQY80371.1 Trk family potassium uptake protein [Keratinibaculum paraultunense]TCS90898.1 trk system potassium uptake protein TrkH [Keratinibaculum paraultunense]
MTSIQKYLDKLELNPPRFLVVGFGVLIILGALLLSLPIATKSGEGVGFINALFTSASAVCVTGLTVVNTAQYWSLFGQIVILVLIQIGGLGFMTSATIMALLVGRKISLRERLIIKEQLNQNALSGMVRLTRYVILSTFIIEGIGAIFLSTSFIPRYGFKTGVWFSIFHAISAFCNAGFDIIGNSMMSFVGDFTVNMTICLLIIIGGLGFSVLIDISNKKNFKRLNLHSKLVLSITSMLIIVGMIVIFIVEWNNPDTLKRFSVREKLLASFFQAVIPRTAGFNSIDISKIYDTTAFMMIILMFIGGSSGSTAGGIKTTTFGAALLTTLAVIRGDKDVVAFNRRINQEIINRSLAIISIGLILILTVSIILTITEDSSFLDILFETTSAFGTVGLTRGITPNLSNIGKIMITLTMYAGRVGPLTMAFAFAERQKQSLFRYSEENITVG